MLTAFGSQLVGLGRVQIPGTKNMDEVVLLKWE